MFGKIFCGVFTSLLATPCLGSAGGATCEDDEQEETAYMQMDFDQPGEAHKGVHHTATRVGTDAATIDNGTDTGRKVLTCRPGSPSACTISEYAMSGTFSPGRLLRVENGHQVYRSTETNSCPVGWKIWSARNREDMQTVINTVGAISTHGCTPGPGCLGGPYFIVDVTRPSDGCGGCTSVAMNSDTAGGGWVTTDGTPWYLRGTPYSEPNGDYTANCYLFIYGFSDADSVLFNDGSCAYSSSVYLCQPEGFATTRPTGTPTAVPTAPTAAPTTSPSAAPTPVLPPTTPLGQATAKGDPHLLNIHGQHFDILQSGWHILLNIPQFSSPSNTKLRVDAKAAHIGSSCADLYFQMVNITGFSVVPGGLHYSVGSKAPPASWQLFGRVSIKVAKGKTAQGVHYLNVLVKGLGQETEDVGGLLGLDDHSIASRPNPLCNKKTMALMAIDSHSERTAQSVGK